MTFHSSVEKLPEAKSQEGTDPLRTSVRFPLRLPVRLRVNGREMAAMTEDISASGALFSMLELPPTDSRVEWTLCLPADSMGAKTDVTVHCTGRIVRHSQDENGGRLVGVLIDEYTFKEGNQ